MCVNRTVCVCVYLCRPTSLDAFVFGFVAPLYKAGLPSSPLQRHLTQLDNITRFCDNILAVYFSPDRPGKSAAPTAALAGNSPTFSKHTRARACLTPSAFSSFCLCFTSCLLSVSAYLTLAVLASSLLGFPPHLCPGSPQPVQDTKDANLQKLTQLVNKESNLIEKVPLLPH